MHIDGRFGLWVTLAAGTLMVGAGCAGPPPRLFPVVPLQIQTRAEGGHERLYDTDGNGRVDYCERLSKEGVITALGYDTNGDGTIDEEVKLASIPPEQCRQLILILDSIPYGMVQEVWSEGRLRFFRPPTRVVSTFPVMTDVALAELFGLSPIPGIESEYFDGKHLNNGYLVYANKGNVPWHAYVDYWLEPIMHAAVYLGPDEWYNSELRSIQEAFEASKQKKFAAYSVGSSAMGARIGRNGHQAVLVRLDRFCQELMHKAHGRLRLTMLSDHGHSLVASQRVPLSDMLAQFGYRVHETLEKPGDVVVPEFGMVTCAAIHTLTPAAVAGDVVGIEGIELAAYRDTTKDEIILVSRNGRARIAHSPTGLRYQAETGDPLELVPIMEKLTQQGSVDGGGFVDDKVLFEATVDHTYPDAVYRLWRAFHGLVVHTPDVLLSVQDGWHCGSRKMSSMVRLTAAHGNLHPMSTMGFALTMVGRLPPVLRMADLGDKLQQMGVPLREKAAGAKR